MSYLTDIEVADARSPAHCEAYPVCDDCDCTKKVRFRGEPLLDHLHRTAAEPVESPPGERRPTRWLGWRGQIGPEEARKNRAGRLPGPVNCRRGREIDEAAEAWVGRRRAS